VRLWQLSEPSVREWIENNDMIENREIDRFMFQAIVIDDLDDSNPGINESFVFFMKKDQ